jgi:hypothetical protein
MSAMDDVTRLYDELRPVLEQREDAAEILKDLAESEECACKKMKSLKEFTVLHTGVIPILNNVCRGCKEGEDLDRKMCRLVCVSCRKVVMRGEPFQEKDGFKFEPNKTYHVEHCPVCLGRTDKDQQSLILERAVFLNRNKK